jgi:hypothetical protein
VTWCPWDCAEVVDVEPVPNRPVGEYGEYVEYKITHRMRNGNTRGWVVRAKDELDAFMKVGISWE